MVLGGNDRRPPQGPQTTFLKTRSLPLRGFTRSCGRLNLLDDLCPLAAPRALALLGDGRVDLCSGGQHLGFPVLLNHLFQDCFRALLHPGGLPGSASPTVLELCPLWVKSRHVRRKKPCPLYPRKRTCAVQLVMSALCQKRTSRHLLNRLGGGRKKRGRHS
jgi:hypothetical protein